MSRSAAAPPRDPPRIVVVGSTMIDLVAYANPLPRAGETVVGQSFALGFGGKGANQAVMAARLGAEVVFVNCVGDDVFGQMTLENLAREGLATTAVRVTPGSTGVAPIWVEPDGTNRIIVIPGANAAVTGALVREELGGLDGADCVVAQLEVPQCLYRSYVGEHYRTHRTQGSPAEQGCDPRAQSVSGAIHPILIHLLNRG